MCENCERNSFHLTETLVNKSGICNQRCAISGRIENMFCRGTGKGRLFSQWINASFRDWSRFRIWLLDYRRIDRWRFLSIVPEAHFKNIMLKYPILTLNSFWYIWFFSENLIWRKVFGFNRIENKILDCTFSITTHCKISFLIRL